MQVYRGADPEVAQCLTFGLGTKMYCKEAFFIYVTHGVWVKFTDDPKMLAAVGKLEHGGHTFLSVQR